MRYTYIVLVLHTYFYLQMYLRHSMMYYTQYPMYTYRIHIGPTVINDDETIKNMNFLHLAKLGLARDDQCSMQSQRHTTETVIRDSRQ